MRLLVRIPGEERDRLGTGFLVAPGLVATAAHVLAGMARRLPAGVSVRGIFAADGRADSRPVRLEPMPDRFRPDGPRSVGVALLRLSAVSAAAPVLLSGAAEPGDPVWTFGFPGGGQFAGGLPALLTYQGDSRLEAPGLRGGADPGRLVGVVVHPGQSGSAVLNLRTGAVCGLLWTSSRTGSAHMVPIARILDVCPEADPARGEARAGLNPAWLDVLDDAQIRSGGWRYPGPRLRAYLDAAADRAAAQPYFDALTTVTGSPLPALTAVYMRQKTELRVPAVLAAAVNGGPAAVDVAEVLPADTVVQRGENCIVVGAAGSGKSSLLLAGLVDAAARWQRERTGRTVPVLLRAAYLAPDRPVPELVADAVAAELGDGTGDRRLWPASFFAAPPLRDVGWLLLVDGLDEIVDPAVRQEIVAKLDRLAEGGTGLPYRIVVTTRQLPDDQLPGSGSGSGAWAGPYRLLPFEARQFPVFAEHWFRGLDLPDPDRAAQGFAAEIERNGLTELAGTPLMATILCLLKARSPEVSLPLNRYEAYDQFTDLLAQGQYRRDPGGLSAQIQETFGRFTSIATEAAERALHAFEDALTLIAAHRLDGSDKPAVDVLCEDIADFRPHQVPEPLWQAFAVSLLRRSGLFTEHGGRFHFFHPTLAEFLLARYVLDDRRRKEQWFHETFEQRTRQRPWDPRKAWNPRAGDWGVSGFVVAGWKGGPDLIGALLRLAGTGELMPCRFVARLVVEGNVKDPAVRDRVADRLAVLAGAKPPRFARQARARDLKLRRWHASYELDDLGDPRGQRALAAGLTERSAAADRWQVMALSAARSSRGADLLAEFAMDPSQDDGQRGDAAAALASAADPRGFDLLEALATDPGVAMRERLGSAQFLGARQGGQRGLDLLAAFAADTALSDMDRVFAAVLLAGIDGQSATPLVSLAADATLSPGARSVAAHHVVKRGDPRGAQLLAELAADPESDLDWYEGHQWVDRRAHPQLEADYLAALAAGRSKGWGRMWAALKLMTLNDSRGFPALLGVYVHVAASPRRRMVLRHSLAESAMGDGDSRGADLLAGWAEDVHQRPRWREMSAESLAKGGDPRGADLLVGLATDADFGLYYRRKALTALIGQGDPRGLRIRDDSWADQAQDRRRTPMSRRKAARVLIADGDGRGVEVMAAMAVDVALSDMERRRTVRILLGADPEAGRRALSAVSAAESTGEDCRDLVVAMLAEGEPGRAARLRGTVYALCPTVLAGEFGAVPAARGGRLGPGNWAALAVSSLVLITLVLLLAVFALIVLENTVRIDGDRAVFLSVLQLLLFMPGAACAGFLLGGHLPEVWQSANQGLWQLLIWRSPC
ncbi:S1 family peptidase [Actinacidiphila oryziradicis]|uniref:S1 family peptidase n=1 Tax=Actinacidiphila oryziradicis TaxID=2571141 RepID=UPI001B800C52|nr:serine protease [Actinacidiphila oryziradicis]